VKRFEAPSRGEDIEEKGKGTGFEEKYGECADLTGELLGGQKNSKAIFLAEKLIVKNGFAAKQLEIIGRKRKVKRDGGDALRECSEKEGKGSSCRYHHAN